jgi:hypothetical protein
MMKSQSSQSSLPGLTRQSMMLCHEIRMLVGLPVSRLIMDARVKPAHDGGIFG